MADPADDGKAWLGVPDRIWSLIFISIATAVMTYFSNRTKTAVDDHAATQAVRQQEIKTEQAEVKTAVAAVKEAVTAVPQATANAVVATTPASTTTTNIGIEVKPAAEKPKEITDPPDVPPGGPQGGTSK